MSEHTPTPWAIDNDFLKTKAVIYDVVLDSDIAWVHKGPEGIDNAEFIVRAVNSHQALVEALEKILWELPIKRDWLDPDIERLAKEALTAAKGE